MAKAHLDDLQTLQALLPFAVVLDGQGQQVVLAPWRELRSFGRMVNDETSMRQLLADAGRNEAVMAALRRMSVDTGPTLGGVNRLDNGKILDAIAKAVADGQIDAVVAETPDRRAPATGSIAYGALMDRFRRGAGAHTGGPDLAFFEYLAEELPDLWCQAYPAMPGSGRNIVQVNDEGYVFLFDLAAERVVVAYGVSRYNAADRDASRMAGFLGKVKSKSGLAKIVEKKPSELGQAQKQQAQLGWRDRFFKTYGQLYDRGHFMSHRQGGGLDINLFPQRADINQGQGRLGVLYRTMESACVADQVFCFSRPSYDDESWVPYRLEYGVCQHRNRWSVKVFPNR